MTIEHFLRGCFDCGYEAAVILTPEGVWRISVYDGANVYESRYRVSEGLSWEAAEHNFADAPWTPSTKDAIAAAQAAGGWENVR